MTCQANYSYQSLPRRKSESLLRGQDEIGTPYCVTVDFDSLQNGDVTLRDRDSTLQERVKVSMLAQKL